MLRCFGKQAGSHRGFWWYFVDMPNIDVVYEITVKSFPRPNPGFVEFVSSFIFEGSSQLNRMGYAINNAFTDLWVGV